MGQTNTVSRTRASPRPCSRSQRIDVNYGPPPASPSYSGDIRSMTSFLAESDATKASEANWDWVNQDVNARIDESAARLNVFFMLLNPKLG